ncbi:MAG: leucyl aminopeptidase [Porticoccus sp.]
MQLTAAACDLFTKKTDCLVLVLGNQQDDPPLQSPKHIDTTIEDLIKKLKESGDIKETIGSSIVINNPDGLQAKRLLIFSSGEKSLNEQSFIKLATSVGSKLIGLPIKDALISLEDIAICGREKTWEAQQFSRILGEQNYSSGSLKTSIKKIPSLKKVTLALSSAVDLQKIKQACILGSSIAKGVNLSRHLGDLPGNICTPSYLATEAEKLAAQHPQVACKILNEKEMTTLGMGSLLSVTAGTQQPAKMIILQYFGANKKDSPVALVGKGVTFDSGGISLKSGAGMDEMKYDMCGAASVLGIFSMLIDMNLRLNVVGIIPAVENMPGGSAIKPGDIVTSMSGQTIEILNTDAEGRLILCDALTYANRYKPKIMIDIATLTGACVMTLGGHASALLSNNDALAESLEIAGNSSGDRVWRLPLWGEYDKQLKSNFADMANIGGRTAGTITAACFLARFIKNGAWAHLDIAGTAWKSGADKGSTGRPVPLLAEFLIKESSND